MGGDLSALKHIYHNLDKAYEGDSEKMLDALQVIAIDQNALPLVYLIESLADLREDGIIYDLSNGVDVSKAEFNNPDNFKKVYSTLCNAYNKAEENIQVMRKHLLVGVLNSMEYVDKSIINAETLILESEWDIANLDEDKLSLSDMKYIMQMTIISGKVKALQILMNYENFAKVFESNYDLFIEMMLTSVSSDMCMAVLDYISDYPHELYHKDLLDAIDNLSLKELQEKMEDAISFQNAAAMNLLLKSKLLKADSEEAIDLISKLLNPALALHNLEVFDNMMSIIGRENINMPLFEGGETLFQAVLIFGNKKWAEHIVEHYLITPELQKEALTYINNSGENALHRISPKIDYEFLSKLMGFDGVEVALEARVESYGNNIDSLTPLLSAVNINGLKAADIMQAYVDTGADIFALDKDNKGIGEWLKCVYNRVEVGQYPVLDFLHEKYAEIDADKSNNELEDLDYCSDSAISDLESSDTEHSSSDESASGASSPIDLFKFTFNASDLVPANFGFAYHNCSRQASLSGDLDDMEGISSTTLS